MAAEPLKYVDLTEDVLKKISPMMRQYLEIKNKFSDCIIMFRLGDFYEMFFDDAILVSAELNLTLTGRDCGLSARAPMCGVPYHAVVPYLNQLVNKGYRIAICEQTTDPTLTKGLVEREVIRVVTPGTMIDESVLSEKKNNYIMSLCYERSGVGYAYSDVSTGCFFAGEFDTKDFAAAMRNEMLLLLPTEVIVPQTMASYTTEMYAEVSGKFYTHSYNDRAFDERKAGNLLLNHFHAASLTGLGLTNMPLAVRAAGALLSYLSETQMNTLRHVTKFKIASNDSFMHLDEFTRANLELLTPLRSDGAKSNTLLNTIDCTKTAMGGRLMREYISRPLQNADSINERLSAVDELYSSIITADSMHESLKGMCDIERLCSKLAYNSLGPRNCVSLKFALQKIWQIKSEMTGFKSNLLKNIYDGLDTLDDLRDLIDAAIIDDPPVGIKDGGIIRSGFDKTVDELRNMTGSGREWLSELEKREREATGIKTLKIGYNRVFGYYFEVSKSFIGQVPERFIRKQTLVNAERYFTAELKALEEQAVSAEEKCIDREIQIFSNIQDAVMSSLKKLQKDAELIAELDVLLSFARKSNKNGYVHPTINNNGIISIKNGRHPMVESNMKDAFNPNDINMDMQSNRALIITGPNMAGKSTYMRQTAIIVLMAHIGCFVPADSANICIVDRIFTRVGASDNLASGQSTFMVEMSEMACILNSATEKSLLILDEIGRGTATYDGLSIAWATLEHIVNVTGAKTMFATHYHELISLENEYDCVKNYSVAVKEVGDSIVFLHKIVRGGADKSFGIQVAALAGLPDEVVARAKLILREHEGLLSLAQGKVTSESESEKQKRVIADELYDEICAIDPEDLTPKAALNLIYRLKSLTDTEN